jgi:hypothetical protein
LWKNCWLITEDCWKIAENRWKIKTKSQIPRGKLLKTTQNSQKQQNSTQLSHQKLPFRVNNKPPAQTICNFHPFRRSFAFQIEIKVRESTQKTSKVARNPARGTSKRYQHTPARGFKYFFAFRQ